MKSGRKCKAFIHIFKQKKKGKFDSKSKECIFTGYFAKSKGYELVNPNNSLQIIKVRDVTFIENQFVKENDSEVKGDVSETYTIDTKLHNQSNQ